MIWFLWWVTLSNALLGLYTGISGKRSAWFAGIIVPLFVINALVWSMFFR